MTKRDGDSDLRGDGRIYVPDVIRADNLAEATYKSILASYDGARIETPKHKKGFPLGHDAVTLIDVKFPDSEPKIYSPGMHEGARGLMQYILEVTHGIHNDWKKTPKHPHRWNYTYNERFVDQIPFMFKKIKDDWDEKMNQWGEGIGRPSGRDYYFAITRPGEDMIPEQKDPPCFQLGQLRFMLNEDGKIVMSYLTGWRSRDKVKAWEENCVAQVELMKLMAAKNSDMLGIEILLGNYVDISFSDHIYGEYHVTDMLDGTIEMMRKYPYDHIFTDDRGNERCYAKSLEDFLGDKTSLKRLIAAQMHADKKGHGKNLPKERLEELEYDIENFPYPSDWDTWPKEWDAKPDVSKLARVVDDNFIDKEISKRLKIISNSPGYSPGEKTSLEKESHFGDKEHIMGE